MKFGEKLFQTKSVQNYWYENTARSQRRARLTFCLACFIFTTSPWEPRLAQTTHGGTRVDRVMLWCLKCFFFFFDIIYTLQKWLKLCWWSPIKYTSVPSESISWLSEKVRVLLKGLYFYFVAMVTFLASTSAHAHQWLGVLDDSLDVLGSYFTPVPMGR